MIYILSCVWLDYMVQYFQCKNCVGSSPKTKKCVASFLVPVYNRFDYQSGFSFAYYIQKRRNGFYAVPPYIIPF